MTTTPRNINKTPTQQIFLSGSGTYTAPLGVKWLRVRMVGGGGGSAGSGAGSSTAGGTGGVTTFGTSFLTANGGVGGVPVLERPTVRLVGQHQFLGVHRVLLYRVVAVRDVQQLLRTTQQVG